MKKLEHLAAPASVWLSVVLCTVGCGGGDGGGDGGGTGGTGSGMNAPPIAVSGPDQDTSRLFTVTLVGAESSDPDGDQLTYTWTQVSGPDATGGVGELTGASPSFQAPFDVGTLVFELVVNDGELDSEPATVAINVFEDQNVAYFVSGDTGSDEEGTGSRDNPFASIAKALCEVTDDRQDIYVATLTGGARYDETIDPCPGEAEPRDASLILSVPSGTSLYGGYDSQWRREWQPDLMNPGDSHIADPTGVDVGHHGVIFGEVTVDAWISGFDLQASNSPTPGDSVSVVSAVEGGAANMYVSDNTIIAGNVAPGTSPTPGSSYGVRVALSGGESGAYIERNLIVSGIGGDGQDVGNTFSQAAPDGSSATGTSGADGKGGEDYDGGGGGAPGTSLGDNGSTGGRGQGPGGNTGGLGGCGGGASSSSSCNGGGSDSGAGQNGYGGANGPGGNGGGAGPGGLGDGGVQGGAFVPGNGRVGGGATAGRGGGGGGGGEANAGVDGGRGGGAGGGGAGGGGGPGGPGGGASIGVLIAGATTSIISDNQIDSGLGGFGAAGGRGQLGGDGGTGSNGNSGNGSIIGDGGDGGRGGNGGRGGEGGGGGGGAGGPSFGVLVGSGIAPDITGNAISSGPAGNGGAGADSDGSSNGNAGSGGEGGFSYALYDADVEDDAVPAASGNTLNFSFAGDGGPAGVGGSSAGQAGDPGQANVRNW